MISHEMSADGLTLVSKKALADGRKLTVKTSWRTVGEATKNRATAEKAFETRLDGLVAEASDLGESGRRRVRLIGPVRVVTTVGSPTWWLPRAHVKHQGRWELGFGWLRCCVQIFRAPGNETAITVTDG